MGIILRIILGERIYINNKYTSIIRKIGEGAYSYVYLVKIDCNFYALKKVSIQSDSICDLVKNEINLLNYINHENIIKLYESEFNENQSQAVMLMQFYRGGSLSNYVQSLTYSHLNILIKNISDALCYLHTLPKPITHRDIKPDNILYDNIFDKFVLIDFGGAGSANIVIRDNSHAMELQEIFDSCSTPQYRAPELFSIHSNSIISDKIDIWSFGATIYHVLYAYPPCDGTALSAINFKLPTFSDDTIRYNNFLNSTLQVNPNHRISASQLSQMNF